MQLNQLKDLFDPTTDNYFVCAILCDGYFHNSMDIMSLKDKPGFICRNFAVRSRISNIKEVIELHGWTIESVKMERSNCHKYRIVERQAVLAI
jgi:hypothetical protein